MTSTCGKDSNSAPASQRVSTTPSRYQFGLASPDDDAQLRTILAKTPMPGGIGLSFRREPSYFAAAEVEGPFHQVIACRHVASQQIVGLGSRSIAMRWLNGQPQPVGYLSQLRLLAEHRRQGLVARGYARFRELHQDGRAPFYLTTIAEGNKQALDLLTSGRAGLPAYHDVGRYHTLALNRRALRCVSGGIELRRSCWEDRASLLRFLAAEGSRRQFFPVLNDSDLFSTAGMFRGLRPENIWLALSGDVIVGMAGVWNQRSFRQQHINGYHGCLRWLRLLYNLAAPVLDWPKLPARGSDIACRFVALPVAREHDANIMLALLQRAVAEDMPRNEHLLIGVHEQDPAWPVLKDFSVMRYATRMFIVDYDDGDEIRKNMDGRPIYLELGCL